MDQRWYDPPATMRKRGRKSAASLVVIVPDVPMQRPEPSAKLSAEEQAIWREIVAKVRPAVSGRASICWNCTSERWRMSACWPRGSNKPTEAIRAISICWACIARW